MVHQRQSHDWESFDESGDGTSEAPGIQYDAETVNDDGGEKSNKKSGILFFLVFAFYSSQIFSLTKQNIFDGWQTLVFEQEGRSRMRP